MQNKIDATRTFQRRAIRMCCFYTCPVDDQIRIDLDFALNLIKLVTKLDREKLFKVYKFVTRSVPFC